MKSFLLKNGVPILKWGLLKDGVLFKGEIPDGYDLAIAPTPGYIIIDVDNKNGKCGSKNIPKDLLNEFKSTLSYNTKNGGLHYWFKYTGDKILPNTTSNLSIDLRVGSRDDNCGGYAKWHPRDAYGIMDYIDSIKDSSPAMNKWIETTFCYIKKK